MIRQVEKKTPEQMVEAVFALNLDPIKFKLMDRKEGHGWTREEADRHELEYRRFLALVVKYPDAVITPDVNVDKFWHGHILDTMKYAEDCQAVFGYFLHHFPYFGMRDAEDAANLAEAAAQTRRLYEQEFESAAAGDAAYCARAADATYCARVAGTEETAPGASYCARVAAYTGKEAAYCAAAAPSYCARVAGAAQAYCAVTSAGYRATVLGKGRPTLESATA